VEEARERQLELRVGEEEHAAPREGGAVLGDRAARPRQRRRHGRVEPRVVDAERVGGGAQPPPRPLGAERVDRVEPPGAAALQRPQRVVHERLREQHARVGPHRRQRPRAARREEAHRPHAHRVEQPPELVLDHVGHRAHHEERRRRVGRLGGALGHHRRQAGVLALGERGLDAAPRVAQHAHVGPVPRVEALGGAREVELDHLARARPDEEERPHARPPRQQLADHAIELVVRIGHPRQVAVLEDGRGEARLGEDHHARRGLQQVRAGARPDDEEEGVLHLAVQPHDAREAAEHLALSTLAEHRQRVGRRRRERARRRAPGEVRGGGERRAHAATPRAAPPARDDASSSRAARSLSTNCAAFTA
jgi:hypothetical protein